MKYKALITRSLTMCDEAIQIIINDTEDFSLLKERVQQALKLCDQRANTQMFRLFEDTSLTQALSVTEYICAERAASFVYPLNTYIDEISLGEDAAIEFSKINASGEVVKLFLHDITNYDNLEKAIDSILTLLDERLLETNTRELNFIEYLKTLPYETRLKVCMVMDILYGRNTKENVISAIQQENSNELPNGVVRVRNEE